MPGQIRTPADVDEMLKGAVMCSKFAMSNTSDTLPKMKSVVAKGIETRRMFGSFGTVALQTSRQYLEV